MIKTLKENIVALVAVSFAVGGSLFLSSLSLSFLAYGRKDSPNFQLWVLFSMIIGYLLVISIYGIYLYTGKRSFTNELRLDQGLKFRPIMFSILTAFGIILFTVLFALVFPAPPGTLNQTTSELTQYVGPLPMFVTVLYPIVFAPLFEELLYRGVFGSLFKVFDTKSITNKVLFVLSNTLIFGALHYQTTGTSHAMLVSFLFPTISGLVFSLQYLKTKNLYYPIISHAVYNLIVVMVSTA